MNKTFMAAAREFFGLKPGQTPIQFGQKIKALTPKDRADLTALSSLPPSKQLRA